MANEVALAIADRMIEQAIKPQPPVRAESSVPMKLITPKGTIVEGHMLTAEDVAVFAELTEPGLGIYAASPCYIPSREIAMIAAYLITTFEMKRRGPLPESEGESA